MQKNSREKVNVGIRAPYFRVVGIQVDTEGNGRSTGAPIRPEEEEAFRRLAAQPNIYETIAKSIAPSIYGSIDMKKAIACLLFGGSRKRYCLYCLSLKMFLELILNDLPTCFKLLLTKDVSFSWSPLC